MSRITTYTGIGQTQGKTDLEDDDVLLLDGTNGSRKITAKELANAMMDKGSKSRAALPVGRSGLYRGASLGSGATFAAASTSAQRSAISDGSFDGLFIGDYWTVNGRVYRIADFNYWKRTGDTDFNTNHVVLVPDNSFGNGQMNSTNITTGAYVGSEMYTDANSVLNAARTAIATDFGGYLASHKLYLPNAVTDGKESAGAWYTSTVELMSEIMVYGCKIRNPGNFYTTEKSQLALFRLNPAMVNLRYNYWLRDVVSASRFAFVDAVGSAGGISASNSYGVRPAFPIKGTA